ncbi:MAG: hypothetical protein GKR89_23085 [Candidatus Latescibacteria bacterium]|nr:hypothetical protein [Candidatus Latescibacterota bacterium]
MDINTVLAWRLERQGLVRPVADESAYRQLVELVQPVAPEHFTMPGTAPKLVHRAAFDDRAFNDGLRGRSELVKGRFWGGNIGYVLAGALEVYGTAFAKDIERFSAEQETVLQALRFSGPLTPRQLADETGMTNKRLMPVLHRLQRTFLVYEAQEDSSWERGWYLFASRWPEIDLSRLSWQKAATAVLQRFVESHVFATFEQIRNWSQWPLRDLKALLQEQEESGNWIPLQIEGLGNGWVRAEDKGLAERQPEAGVFMLHKADPLVKSHAAQLKEQFADREVLQYLLVDGRFAGAVCGHWRIGPHDIEDIAVHLPDEQVAKRRQEIIAQVAKGYHPPHSQIKRYAGQVV